MSEGNKEIKTEEEKNPDQTSKKNFKMKLFKMFSFMKKKKVEDDQKEETPRAVESEEDDAPQFKLKFPFKEAAIVAVLSILLSVILIFVFDVAGWRSSMRSNITTKLLGMEKQLLIEKYEYEYTTKLDEEKALILKEERAMLVVEYQTLDDQKEEYDKREKAILKEEEELLVQIEVFEKEKIQFEIDKEAFEEAVIEVTDLGKIYVSMEPKNAAAIFTATTDESLMLQILSTMKSDDVASILELMETQKAADILSELNKNN